MTSASTSSEAPIGAENQNDLPTSAENITRPESAEAAASKMAVRKIKHGSDGGENPISVEVTQGALSQLDAHCYSVLDFEIGGALLGKALGGDYGTSVQVQAALPVKTYDHGPVHFTFSADSWAELHREKNEQYPHLDIVGWYHTHPGLGVFFSADDVVVHSAAFVMPWHVGLVIDPIYKEGCWFGWRIPPVAEQEPELTPITGFVEIADEDSESELSWQLVTSRVWDADFVDDIPLGVSDQVYAPASDWPSLPPISPWWGVLLGGTSLVLVLLLLLDRLLSLIE